MSDTSTAKPGILARLRAFLDELGADEGIEAGEKQEIEAATEDEARAAEIDAAETEETEAEVEDEEPTEPGEPADPDAEATPGSEQTGDAEDADLRAQLTEQAALIETLRNTIAELGGVDPTEEVAPETTAEAATENADEAQVVEDFDADYDRRKAILADLDKEN